MRTLQAISATVGAALILMGCAGNGGSAGPQAQLQAQQQRPKTAAEAAAAVKPPIQAGDPHFPPNQMQVTVPLDGSPSTPATPATGSKVQPPPDVTTPR